MPLYRCTDLKVISLLICKSKVQHDIVLCMQCYALNESNYEGNGKTTKYQCMVMSSSTMLVTETTTLSPSYTYCDGPGNCPLTVIIRFDVHKRAIFAYFI